MGRIICTNERSRVFKGLYICKLILRYFLNIILPFRSIPILTTSNIKPHAYIIYMYIKAHI